MENALVDRTVEGAAPLTKFQFERQGYFCVDFDSTKDKVITSKCSALWGRSSRHVTVGFCMKVVEIGLATHLRYIRPCTRTYVQTELPPEPLRGGSAPNYASLFRQVAV